ncbi:MAG: hypothetical protein U0232_28865 [Thermomicrobiales bacterium]
MAKALSTKIEPQQEAEGEAQAGEDRGQGVAQDVEEDDVALGEALARAVRT